MHFQIHAQTTFSLCIKNVQIQTTPSLHPEQKLQHPLYYCSPCSPQMNLRLPFGLSNSGDVLAEDAKTPRRGDEPGYYHQTDELGFQHLNASDDHARDYTRRDGLWYRQNTSSSPIGGTDDNVIEVVVKLPKHYIGLDSVLDFVPTSLFTGTVNIKILHSGDSKLEISKSIITNDMERRLQRVIFTTRGLGNHWGGDTRGDQPGSMFGSTFGPAAQTLSIHR